MSITESLKAIKTIQEKYPEIGGTIPELNFEDLSDFEELITQFRNNTVHGIENITEEKQKEKFSSKLEEILNNISKLKDSKKEKEFIEELKRYIPYFIFFNSFDDVFSK